MAKRDFFRFSRVRTLLFSFALGTICSGCGKDDSGTRWNSFPVSVYLDREIANGADSEMDFRVAMNFWEAKAGRKLFDFRGVWTGGAPFSGPPAAPSQIFANVVLRLDPWTFAANTAGQTVVRTSEGKINASVILINPEMNFCTGDCQNDFSRPSARKLFAHELGHFIGMNHVGDANNIMYPDLIPGGLHSGIAVDMSALVELTK